MLRRMKTGVLLLVLLAVAACNTVQGAGKDLESAARKGKEVLH